MTAMRRLIEPDTAILVDGVEVPARVGETVAAALLVAGHRRYFCGMGVCYACLVTIDDALTRLACLEAVRPGMRVELPFEEGTRDG